MSADYEPFDADAYEDGRSARRAGLPKSANPYEVSGHERDTTPSDERHHDWLVGWGDEEIRLEHQ